MSMLDGHRNTKKQGDVGVGMAIGWCVSMGWTVSVPLTDSQEYDLVAEINGILQKIQVKTTRYKTKYGFYNINISVKGGNRTSIGTIKHFDNSKVDFLFVIVGDGRMYFIPSKEVLATGCLTIGRKYDKCEVKFGSVWNGDQV